MAGDEAMPCGRTLSWYNPFEMQLAERILHFKMIVCFIKLRHIQLTINNSLEIPCDANFPVAFLYNDNRRLPFTYLNTGDYSFLLSYKFKPKCIWERACL